MNPDRRDGQERREGIRREEDSVIDYRLGHIEETISRMDTAMAVFGSATAHLALLDHRSDDNERRIDILEKAVDRLEDGVNGLKIALEGVRIRVMLFSGVGSIIGTGLIAVLVKYT